MHENQQTKEVVESQIAKQESKRPYKYYVLVTHRQLDLNGHAMPAEFLSFDDKSSLRAGLDNSKYEDAQLRIVRGYEMNVKAKRHISIN